MFLIEGRIRIVDGHTDIKVRRWHIMNVRVAKPRPLGVETASAPLNEQTWTTRSVNPLI
jgi:hypothetical protein